MAGRAHPPQDHPEPIRRFYRGRSMARVFKPGDLLLIEAIPIEKLWPGDIIAYASVKADPAGADTVHRVISVGPHGVICRGDNNRNPDPSPVTTECLIGRVVEFERAGRRHRIRGGRAGTIRARMNRARSALAMIFTAPLRPFYLWLRKSGLAARVWKPEIRRIRFCSPGGDFIKYLHRGKTVSSRIPDEDVPHIKKPYDLILWERLAPEGAEKDRRSRGQKT